MELTEGVYENIISKDVEASIADAEGRGLVCKRDIIDKAEAPRMLANYLTDAIERRLNDDKESTESKADFINTILKAAGVEDREKIVGGEQMLTEVINAATSIERQNGAAEERPLSGFRVSNLFTGGQSAMPLEEEIGRDIATADEIYIIVAFLKLSGIRMMLNRLRHFCESGRRLRIITTTYCGNTDPRAIEQIAALPNTEVRISYDTKNARLHAKSYIFIRNSGFSTAYIGSSNFSHSALATGLEWNIRVTQAENPHIIRAAVATFERYWDSPHFEDFAIGGIEKFCTETQRERSGQAVTTIYPRFTIQPHQKAILDKLQVVRVESGLKRNLVVAATGTGKTVISAFDYQRYKESRTGVAKLLFIAHREEILKQSLATFRSVIGDYNFGDIWVGNKKAEVLDHLFISVQTLNSQKESFKKLGKEYYDFIIIDEAHHGTAESYKTIFDTFTPDILLGLTATPERMDGQSLLPLFGDRISAEVRLPEALAAGLLTPFHYLCITDSVTLADKELWEGSKYNIKKLSERLCNPERTGLIIGKLQQYLADEHDCRALCFCTDKKHATFMAEAFNEAGLKAAALTSDTNHNEREQLNKDLSNGTINYLFVVDIFNEGVDIPSIDTTLFLRPTESLTIFLQQLGRGLRLSPGKECLTVLDFVAQANQSYDFASRFRALTMRQSVDIKTQVEHGFIGLPPGCYIYMEEKAQQYILDNIQKAIYNITRLRKELLGYDHTPTLSEFLNANGQDIRLIYRGDSNCWTTLKRAAGKVQYKDDEYSKVFAKNMGYLVHVNTPEYISFIRKALKNDCDIEPKNEAEEKYALMLYYTLYKTKINSTKFTTIYEAIKKLNDYTLFKTEISEICDYLMDLLETEVQPVAEDYPGLKIYGCYTRDEIFILLNLQTATKTMDGVPMGVFNVPNKNAEFFLVTLNKSDKDFSPTTQYKDYFISKDKFHWQSQGKDNNGGRFAQQPTTKRHFILFVREDTKDAFNNTSPFICLGLVDHISSYGDHPTNVEWRMQAPALPRFIKAI